MAVVITGVGQCGIGAACAVHLARQGLHIYGSVRKPEDAAYLQQLLGADFSPLIMDITDAAAVAAAADHVRASLNGQPLTALVNNAGINVAPHPLMHMPLDMLRRQMEVNFIAQLQVIQAFVPLLRKDNARSGRQGRIINMSSVYGSYGMAFQGPYCASKSALEGMSDALRQEMRIYEIPVILIRPGPIKTSIWAKGQGSGASQAVSGIGDWHAYDDTDFAGALASTRQCLNENVSKPGFLMPPERVACVVGKAITKPKPKVAYVITPNWFENWFAPRWFPKVMVDGETCRRFGIR